MRTQLRILLALAALALPAQAGCSLLKLDEIDRTQCATDMDCADLEAIRSTGSACRTWQCEPGMVNGIAGRYCVEGVRDDDNDRVPPAMCVTAPAPADCDDMTMTTAPGAPETCNLVDDNCDGIVDNGFGSMSSIVIMADAPASNPRTSISQGFADDGSVTVAQFRNNQPIRFGSLTPGANAVTPLSLAASARVEGTFGAHANLDERGVLAVFDPPPGDETCLPPMTCGDGRCNPRERVSVGACPADCPATCGDGTCAAAAMETHLTCPTDCEPTIAQWLSGSTAVSACFEPTRLNSATLTPSSSGDALLVWVDDAGERACGSATSAPVYARMIRARMGGAREIVSSGRINLGTTRDWLGASTLFVEGIGFVVAHVNDAGAVELDRIEVLSELDSVAATPLGVNDATAASEVSLATAGERTIVVAFTDGACDAPNRIALQSVVLSPTSATWTSPFTLQAAAGIVHRFPVVSRSGAVGTTLRRGEFAVFYGAGPLPEPPGLPRAELHAVRVAPDLSAIVGTPITINNVIADDRPFVSPVNVSWGFVTSTTAETVVSGTLSCIEGT